MRRMRILATAAGVAGVIAVVVVSYLLLELSQTKADLQDTQEALVQSNVDLQASMEAHDVLAADVTTVTGDLADVKADRDRLRDEAHELSEENRTLTHEKSVLTQEHDHLKDTLEQLTATHQQLTTRHLTLQADHAELNDQHSLLQQSIGTVQALESQAGSLRTEIARLEALHKPLILRRTAEIGALCTGSMEPKLTCLDTVTYLLDFDPADIVPGTMISFESRACWPNDPSHSYTGHRVMNIRVTGGIYYYWPKGDANSKADGCWVPHTA
ncbi:MAG: hypothetical protein OXN15_02955, partial [Chloroflexota bacterium]|nr:hypothetical protein [Chloroflexota bacterium]